MPDPMEETIHLSISSVYLAEIVDVNELYIKKSDSHQLSLEDVKAKFKIKIQ